MSNEDQLKEETAKVVADNIFKKSMRTYVSKGQRSLLAMTVFDGNLTSRDQRKLLKGHPELENSLHKLFEVLNEVLDEDIEDGELNDDSEVSSLNTDTRLPKLFAPFKDKARGWTVKKVEQQALLYINILGYGNGGQNTLALETFDPPANLKIQDWREYLVTLGRNSEEAFNGFEGTREEWNRQWDQLRIDGVYEITAGDFLLPALSHALGLDILVFNTNQSKNMQSGANGPLLLVQSDCWGGKSSLKPPLLILYIQEAIMKLQNLHPRLTKSCHKPWSHR